MNGQQQHQHQSSLQARTQPQYQQQPSYQQQQGSALPGQNRMPLAPGVPFQGNRPMPTPVPTTHTPVTMMQTPYPSPMYKTGAGSSSNSNSGNNGGGSYYQGNYRNNNNNNNNSYPMQQQHPTPGNFATHPTTFYQPGRPLQFPLPPPPPQLGFYPGSVPHQSQPQYPSQPRPQQQQQRQQQQQPGQQMHPGVGPQQHQTPEAKFSPYPQPSSSMGQFSMPSNHVQFPMPLSNQVPQKHQQQGGPINQNRAPLTGSIKYDNRDINVGQYVPGSGRQQQQQQHNIDPYGYNQYAFDSRQSSTRQSTSTTTSPRAGQSGFEEDETFAPAQYSDRIRASRDIMLQNIKSPFFYHPQQAPAPRGAYAPKINADFRGQSGLNLSHIALTRANEIAASKGPAWKALEAKAKLEEKIRFDKFCKEQDPRDKAPVSMRDSSTQTVTGKSGKFKRMNVNEQLRTAPRPRPVIHQEMKGKTKSNEEEEEEEVVQRDDDYVEDDTGSIRGGNDPEEEDDDDDGVEQEQQEDEKQDGNNNGVVEEDDAEEEEDDAEERRQNNAPMTSFPLSTHETDDSGGGDSAKKNKEKEKEKDKKKEDDRSRHLPTRELPRPTPSAIRPVQNQVQELGTVAPFVFPTFHENNLSSSSSSTSQATVNVSTATPSASSSSGGMMFADAMKNLPTIPVPVPSPGKNVVDMPGPSSPSSVTTLQAKEVENKSIPTTTPSSEQQQQQQQQTTVGAKGQEDEVADNEDDQDKVIDMPIAGSGNGSGSTSSGPSLKVKDLIRRCKEKGLKHTGNKAELLARLGFAANGQPATSS